jgi:DeoR/GlpR family transcriptional regulator of sugar metabolism
MSRIAMHVYPKPPRLMTEERRREILNVLDKNGRVTVDEVVRTFGVSAVTARSDLDALSESGNLIRSHGGGIRPLAATPEYSLSVRKGMHHEQKVRIAQAAAQLIRPFQTVFLCSGSTSAELARQIFLNPPENITVITYALNVAATLAEIPNISLVMLGGFLRNPSTALVGPHAEQMLQSLHADHCFLNTVGLHVEVGLTTLDIMEAQLNQRMIQAAAEVTVLADSSKFGHRSLSLISDVRCLRRVITDNEAPPGDVARLRFAGVEVVLT